MCPKYPQKVKKDAKYKINNMSNKTRHEDAYQNVNKSKYCRKQFSIRWEANIFLVIFIGELAVTLCFDDKSTVTTAPVALCIF